MQKKCISTDLLRTLAVAAEGETLTSVARRVGRSQSAISLRMKKLEEELGVQLVRRTGRGAELTDAGHLAWTYARKILTLHDELVSAMAGLEMRGSLRLGLPADLAESWLQSALSKFTRAHPHIHLEVVVARNLELLENVRRGDLDVALAFTVDPPVGGDLLARLPIGWVGRADGPVPQAEELPLVLFTAPCLFSKAGLDALERESRRWRMTMTSPSLAGLCAAIEAGLGVGVRTRLGLPGTLAQLDTPLLPKIAQEVHLALYRADGAASPAISALCEIASESLSDGH